MTSNLWNTCNPTKRIDFYFKIDDYKKHLLQLKNVKSTFKKASTEIFNQNNWEGSLSLRKNFQHNKSSEGFFNQNQLIRAGQITKNSSSTRTKGFAPCQYPRLDTSGLKAFALSARTSPNKFQKFRDRQITQENKKILKKIFSVKPSQYLQKKSLFSKYCDNTQKYKENLQKTRCTYLSNKDQNIDFTKAAQNLLKGQKIKFSKIQTPSHLSEKKTNKIDLNSINFNLKQGQKQIREAPASTEKLPKRMC